MTPQSSSIRVLYLGLPGRWASFIKVQTGTTAPLPTQDLLLRKRQVARLRTQSGQGCHMRTIGLSDQELHRGAGEEARGSRMVGRLFRVS